eukprot:TRINITY_DN397_c0_g1_i1.p1 TRINITY_DN397_c0_g1~~TRINITY_DN397_c0_g1_i1.p1  ORF type:complete len:372 (+),score=72.54 TRINITY_DN397_c0_g1_i1:55-1170(+)
MKQGMKYVAVAAVLFFSSAVCGQGGNNNGAVPGNVNSTACAILSGSCAQNGSSNSHIINLSYNPSNGMFNGSIITNQCMNHQYGLFNGTDLLKGHGQATPTCVMQYFPDPAYRQTPTAAILRGTVGLSISGGVNIFGPLEDGFTTGQVCSTGSCPSGLDLNVCTSKLLKECSTLTWQALPDDCGGHGTSPYHLHYGLACEYNTSAYSSHSALIAVGLDGRGIYGKWEGNGVVPSDLDACNGHYGSVPAYTDGNGTSFPSAANVYHYHITDYAPYTVGCFGPVASLSACKTLYNSTCGTGFSCIDTTKGRINFDTDCPCYQQGGATYNQDYNSTCNTTSTTTGSKAASFQTVNWVLLALTMVVGVSITSFRL